MAYPNTLRHFESVLDQLGHGTYNHLLTFICSLANFAVIFEETCLILLLPAFACTRNIDFAGLQLIYQFYLFGSCIGCCTTCVALDMHGRKLALAIYAFVVFINAFTFSFCNSIAAFAIIALINGAFVAGVYASSRILLLENVVARRREKSAVLLALMGMVGSLLAEAIMYNFHWNFYRNDLKIGRATTPWRFLMAFAGLPVNVTSVMTVLIFESSRYLLMKRAIQEVIENTKRVYALNYSDRTEKFEMIDIDLVQVIQAQPYNFNVRLGHYMEDLSLEFKRIWRLLSHLMNFKLNTVLMIVLKTPYFLGLLHVTMWATIFLEQTSSKMNPVTFTIDSKDVCAVAFSEKYFQSIVIFNAMCCVSHILLYFIVEKINRKILLLISSLGSVSCLVFLLFINVNENDEKYWAATVFLLFYSIGNVLVDLHTVETYPTKLRGTANGFINLFPKLLLSIFTFKIQNSITSMAYLMIAFFSFSLIITPFLKHLQSKPMIE